MDVYMDVAARFRTYIERGVYKESEALPSVRAVAADLGVNPNTVQKAYARLESEGYIVVRPKKGAYVARRASAPQEDRRREIIARLKDEGIDRETLMRWIKEIYDHD
ncbi:MAG: GntR family transcriptional regulator [Clostridia bacterium]|nr:GntR family transcriptional regulator [Clostridia bacterium]